MQILEEVRQHIKTSDVWNFVILVLFLLVILCSGQNIDGNYREVIICGATIAVLCVLLGINMWIGVDFYKFTFLFIVLVGSLSLMIQPILNVPDEVAHFARAESVSRGNIIVDSEQTEYETIQSVLDLRDNVKTPYISSTIKEQKIDYTAAKIGHIAASNASFLYFPQAIGILIAKILRLDVMWMLWLARFGNLLCYSISIGLALRITPKLKFVLFFIATLPMSIQQAASCNPDAIINASAILLIAYFLHLYCSKEKKITWKQIIIFFALSVIMTVSKVTNIFIAGLILLLPAEKFVHRKKAILMKCLIIGCVVVVGASFYLYTISFPTSYEHLVYLQSVNADSSKQIQYIIGNFMSWFLKFVAALTNEFPQYINMLGEFGWLEYGCSLIPLVATFLFGKICFQESGIFINKINKVLLFLMVAGIYAVTCLAMYISWTPVGSSEILGVQGRYFIPMFALASLLFASSGNNTDVQQKHSGDMIAILGMNGAMLIITALRYY